MSEEIRQRFAASLDRLAAEVPGLAGVAHRWVVADVAGAATSAAGTYRDVRDCLAEIAVAATELADDRISRWLVSDATTALVVAAATTALEAGGLRVDRGTDAGAQLRGALQWRSYSRNTADDLHRSCARDVSRGSLRLLARAGGWPVDARLEWQRTRLELVQDVRRQFGAARAELLALVPSGRRAAAQFQECARSDLAEVSAAVRAATTAALGPVEPARWRPAEIAAPVLTQRRDEMWLGVVLGAGFGLGSALGLARLCSGPAGLPESLGAVLGLVTGVALTLAVVLVRARQHRRAVLERWVGSAVAAVRQAAEEELAYRLLEAQAVLARTSQIDKLRDSENAPIPPARLLVGNSLMPAAYRGTSGFGTGK
ncbi:MAG: hypothetical protein P4L86_04730 [Mycobacterium sp.]|nr:hypothetical protein [Mycobacterium sp.]